jgi:hypothetical protein
MPSPSRPQGGAGMEKTTENIEQIEHAQHALHDPFNRNVAMTMAIVAAALACVTMLSHREHNRTIQLLSEASILNSEANALHTQSADQWAYYQAKNIRRHNYQALRSLLGILANVPGSESEREKAEKTWDKQLDEYKDELPKHRSEAESLRAKAEEHEKEALEKQHQSEEAHHRGDRFDLAELAVELALVLCSIAVLTKKLCSIAVLTKKAGFWFAGIGCGVIGALVAVSAFMLH